MTTVNDAAHKLAMVKLYRRWLEKTGRAVPAILDRWEAEANIQATRRQDEPQSDTVRVTAEAIPHDRAYLSRTDLQRITGCELFAGLVHCLLQVDARLVAINRRGTLGSARRCLCLLRFANGTSPPMLRH